MRYRPALRDVSKIAGEIASARGGLLPFADRATNLEGKSLGVGRYSMTTVFFVRKDIMEAKGLKPPKVYDPDVVEFAKKTQDASKDLWGIRPDPEPLGRRRRFHAERPVGLRRRRVGQGRQARPRHDVPQGEHGRAPFAVDTIQKHKIQPPGVMGWTDVSNNEAYMAGKLVTTNNGASLYYAMVTRKHELAPKTLCILTPGGPAGSFVASSCYNWAIFQKSQRADLAEDLIRWVEDETLRRVRRRVGRPGRPRVPGARGQPVLEVGSELRRDAPEHPPLRQHRPPRAQTPAAAEVQGQKILTDMAGRVVVGGLSPRRRSRRPTAAWTRSTRSAARARGRQGSHVHSTTARGFRPRKPRSGDPPGGNESPRVVARS